jgi:hypothetical protein
MCVWCACSLLAELPSSAELALPRGPDGIKALAPAGRQLAELVVCLLGELEGVAGDGQGVVVVKDGKKVARVDAGTWGVGDEEGAAAVARRRHEGVHIKITLTLVVWSRRYSEMNQYTKSTRATRLVVLTLDDHDPALNESDCDGTVAQHSGLLMRYRCVEELEKSSERRCYEYGKLG